MTADEVRALPLDQKIQIMETIWQDMRDRLEQSEIPDRVQELLDQRRARAQAGSAKVLDWDAVKASIGRA